MRLSDYVADFIADLGITHVFGVVGGGAMYLNDSFGHHERFKYVACNHEQAAAMAAESYARICGIGCVLVTSGPGGTNAITGIACAWVDSTPLIAISGQVTRDQLIADTGLRQFGVQETDIVTLVKSITKHAVTIKDEKDIRYELEKAAYIANSGRPGPVWIDIPLDIQSKQIDPDLLRGYIQPDRVEKDWRTTALHCLSMLRQSKRPVLIIGNGVRLAGAQHEIRELIGALGIPVISSWSAADMIADGPCHIGHMGLFGDRASNYAAQNADLLLIMGCRMSVPMIGYSFPKFAPTAKIIMVDIDSAEMNKPSLRVDLKIECDAKKFARTLLETQADGLGDREEWRWQCEIWRDKYPVVLPEYAEQK